MGPIEIDFEIAQRSYRSRGQPVAAHLVATCGPFSRTTTLAPALAATMAAAAPAGPPPIMRRSHSFIAPIIFPVEPCYCGGAIVTLVWAPGCRCESRSAACHHGGCGLTRGLHHLIKIGVGMSE